MKKGILFISIFVLAIALTFGYSGGVYGEDDDSDRDDDHSGSGGDDDSDRDEDNSGFGGDDDSDRDDDNSGSGRDDDSDRDDDNSGSGRDRDEVKIEDRVVDGVREVKFESRRRYIDANGNRVEIRVKREIKDGREFTEERIEFVDENGDIIKIRTRTEIRDGEEEFERRLSVNGIEAKTKLRIREDFDDATFRIKLTRSDGTEEGIKIMPNRASEIALRVLEARGFTLELKEVGKKDEAEIVYFAEGVSNGKFLGVINVDFLASVVIDAETGEIRELNRPWWVFLVFGAEIEELSCTEEAFVCPDGTSVVRNQINNCEFDSCPLPLIEEVELNSFVE